MLELSLLTFVCRFNRSAVAQAGADAGISVKVVSTTAGTQKNFYVNTVYIYIWGMFSIYDLL